VTIVAAADGSALGNPGPAGWAWYVDDDHWSAGGWPHGTNNMGELMAVIDLLESTAHIDDDLRILCDSQYVINSVTKWMPGWKRKGWRKSDGSPVLNRELLERLDRALHGRSYTFEWVKGHAGHELNEAADLRARAVATAYRDDDAIPIGPGWPGAAVYEPEPALARPAQAEADATAPAATSVEFDLFDDLQGAFSLEGAETDEEIVARLEQELVDPSVRADASRVAALLHPDFEEIGRSGRLWGRDAILEALAEEDSPAAEIHVLGTERLGSDLILLTARTVDERGGSLRSSLWLRSSGRWRLRFHQGTPEA
jgi:ribonuclease HI